MAASCATSPAHPRCEQFLFFADTRSMREIVISATVANRAHPETPGLQDVGDIHLRAPNATGYVRVDWFTPAGLPTWGDGRLTIVGTGVSAYRREQNCSR